MKYNAIITLTIIHFVFTSCGQTKKESTNGIYEVDSEIEKLIEQKVQSSLGGSIGSMDFKLYENDKLIWDTYDNDKGIECMTMKALVGDTAVVTGFMGMFTGFGFQLTLFKDTCIVHHIVTSDAEIYKLNKTDSLTTALSVPCKTYKLTLVNKPTFEKEEVIQGIIELTSEEYYEVTNGKERKYRIELVGYFKAEPLKSIDDMIKSIDDMLKVKEETK